MESVIFAGGDSLYTSPEESLMAVPYFGYHPTGIVFNVTEYKLLSDRQQMFTKQAAYIHPHDLVLGKLAEYDEMFRFKTILGFADEESFSSNKSFLYKKGTIEDAWFSPKGRTAEFKLFMKAISEASFLQGVKSAKAQQIAKRYLFYCTLNYAYFISNPGQTAHYGIEPKKLSRKELVKLANQFIDNSYETMTAYGLVGMKPRYKSVMTVYFWAIYLGKPIWDKVKS